MADSWTYSKLTPLRAGRPHQFLTELFIQLFLWSKKVTRKHEEFPVGFTEWALAGHFAVAASQPPLNCFSYQDYCVKLTDAHKREKKTQVMRPDLHLRREGWHNVCIFEFKRMFIPLKPSARRDFAKSIPRLIKNAHDQLVRVSSGEWANLICSAIGMTIWLDYMVKGRDRWIDKWEREKVYVEAWNNLLFQKIVPALKVNADDLEKSGHIYYCGYRMPHTLVKTHHDWQEKEWSIRKDKDNQQVRTLPIGMVWILAVQEFPQP